MSIALMYHGLFDGDVDQHRIDAEDLPYGVSVSDFARHLTLIGEKSHGLIEEGKTIPDVVITFDDGHISNYDHAMSLLTDHNMKAQFFVTTAFIGERAHFCDWHHLREMADAGMVIGAHGHTHRFFEDLAPTDADNEFRQSKDLLSQALGREVDSMSFPGGRYSKCNLKQARDAGYRQIFGSVFGKIQASGADDPMPIRRIPVRISTTEQQFLHIINENRAMFFKAQATGNAKNILKKTLGNKLYHGLYKSLAGR